LTRQTEQYWDDVATRWEEAPSRSWRDVSDQVNRTLCRRWFRGLTAQRLLKTDTFDEGVGEGIYHRLRVYAREVVGIDVARTVLDRARARHPELRAIAADVRALPFADESFDLVFSNSTLDHFEHRHEIEVALLELYRVLATGGRLLLTLDNLAHPMVALRSALPQVLLRRLGLVPYYVGSTCGPRRLRRMAEAAGFEVQDMTAVLHGPRLAAVRLSSWLPNFAPRVLRFLPAFERLERLPTRYRTGHFVAVLAIKR